MTKLYAVARAYPWSSVHTGVGPLVEPLDGPTRFLPMFDSYEKAKAWARDGDEIMEMEVSIQT